MRILQFFVPILIFVVLAVFFYGGLYRNPSEITSPLVGQLAPEFSLPTLEDPTIQIGTKDFQGRLTLLNVWGTWCQECYYEHDFLLLLAEYAGIPLYGLNLKDERDRAQNWLMTLGDPYTASAFDEDGRIAIDWGVYGAPETFLIGPYGHVLHKHLSPLSLEIWERDFLPIILETCQDQPCGLGE